MTYLANNPEYDYMDPVERLRTDLAGMVEAARTTLPKSREAALTLTKLEEALMWAQKIEEDR